MLESWEPAAVQSQLPDELSYPPLLLFLLHIWPKWGKMASGAAVHTQPFMKCPTGALELKWEVSREKWKCFDIFMFFPLFQRSWKEPFFVICFHLGEQSSCADARCWLGSDERDLERRWRDLQPSGWLSLAWSLKSFHSQWQRVAVLV